MDQDVQGRHGVNVDSQLIITLGGVSIIFIVFFSFILSFLGCIFLISVLSIIFYISTNISQRRKSLGNYLRSYVPPRTKWCTKIEYDHILVPADVDEALERLYDKIIEEHINTWFKQLSQDEEFQQEIRHIFRDLTQDLLQRLTRVDICEFLLKDVTPAAVQHLDTYLWAVKHSGSDLENVETLVKNWIAFIGGGLHPALASREAENEYFENLSEKIVPLVLQNSNSRSQVSSSVLIALLTNIAFQPLLDLLCEPRIINKLLLLWFGPDPVKIYNSCPDPPVRLLVRFVHNHNQPKPSCLHVDLSAVLKNTDLLYPFLQYLKKNDGVNLLQFCLSVEDFNKKMMVVDLKDDDLKSLHSSARDLYETYIKLGAVNFIKFDDDIIRDISSIINQGYKQVHKLRTSPPLFRAYEQVYNNLEDNLCPQFHNSDEYLKLVLGPRLFDCRPETKIEDSDSQMLSTNKQLKVKLSKLKNEVLGSTTLDGSPEPETVSMDSAYDMTGACEEDEGSMLKDVQCRDLSAWRVSIPRLEPRNDPNTGKACFVFIIQVQRIDVTSEKDGDDLAWVVERQFQEFYSLQTALVQYHGVFDDLKLPSRSKLFGGKGLDVLQTKLEPFQDFLVKLLQKPNLKKSDLLFIFLTSKSEFTEASSRKSVRSVPSIKLTKERGQFLQSFLNLYKSSTQNPPPKPGRVAGGNDQVDGVKMAAVYGDNTRDMDTCHVPSLGPSQHHHVSGLFDIILFLSIRLCSLPEYIIRLLSSIRWLVADSFNHIIHYLLASKLDKLLNSGRIAHLIAVIEESLFEPPRPKMTSEEIKTEANQTLEAFQDYLPKLVKDVVGEEEMKSSTRLIFSALQHPLMNKQLAFHIIEILLVKIFPELKL